MNNIRKNGQVGIIEYSPLIEDKDSYLHFSEWWNGEGLDFNFNDAVKFSLNLDDIAALVTAAIATGYVDVKECKKRAKELIASSEGRRNQIDTFRKEQSSD